MLQLARELAMGIHDADAICMNLGISEQQYAIILNNSFFQTVLASERAAWTAAKNTPERIRIEAAATLEDWLPVLSSRLHNADEGLSAVIEGGKLLARLSGMEGHAGGPSSGEKFVISIDLGSQKIEVEKTMAVVEGIPDCNASTGTTSPESSNSPRSSGPELGHVTIGDSGMILNMSPNETPETQATSQNSPSNEQNGITG